MNKIKTSSRLFVTAFLLVVFTAALMYAISQGMEGIGEKAIYALSSIGVVYIGGDSWRPSGTVNGQKL